MFRRGWLAKRMQLVMAADESGDAVDFGTFFDAEGAGAEVEESEEVDEAADADEDVDESEDDVDEAAEDDEADEQEDEPEAEPDDEQTQTRVSLDAIRQQQKILESLMQKRQDQDEAPEDVEEPVVDPFESQEFKAMADVMNWDADEQAAAKTFFQKFMDYGNQQALSVMSQQTPKMVESTLRQNEQLKNVRQTFYETHPVLKEVKPFVGQIAQSVAKEQGANATMESVLEEAATRAYKALGVDPDKVKGIAEGAAKKGKKKPAFPVKKGTRKQSVKPPKLQQEIDAVIGA